ncbi:HEPN domain-containing protein [Methylosinus sp. R-45379]|uniref:HEPN domain-containing protein n=1 Tax=Methylosinus sp. R-45379 TaxID=980563 RepID=UPI000A00B26B|nr:HEPN domain-containing protein [Methylosinus sp. R-45379]
MSQSAVDRIYTEFRDASTVLKERGEVSLSNAIDESSRKALLLAAASYFELRISEDVLLFCREIAGTNTLVPALIKNKAVSRQYHTWFDWDGNTATKFYSLFGPDFKSHMEDIIKGNSEIGEAVKNFIEVGRDRNRLVHQDFATFSLEKTADEIYRQYRSALTFVNIIPVELRKCSNIVGINDGL